MNSEDKIKQVLAAHKKALDNFPSKAVLDIANAIAESIKKGGKILICGNGGSCSDAQHFAGELVGRFQKERQALPAIALTADTAVLTCISNDYGYANVFARQVEAFAQSGDIFVGITTSGNSENVVKAAETAAKKGLKVIAFSGEKDGKIHSFANLEFRSPSTITATIQEMHITAIHLICGLVEDFIFGE